MIRLKLRRTLRKAHNNRVHGTRNSTHQNAREDQPRHETKPGARGADRAGVRRVIEPTLGTVFVEGVANGRADTADAETEEEEYVVDEIICDDCLPSTVLEEGEDVLSGLEVAVSIKSDIDKCPLIEVFKDAGVIIVEGLWCERLVVER